LALALIELNGAFNLFDISAAPVKGSALAVAVEN
jgi:hypothetical protein